ncbi:MAG: DUF5107 domain-containing protein, partial [Bacteroidetes bacterium]|nr:DUF5107 domain-containing protein [Bacteroidota bacterium]
MKKLLFFLITLFSLIVTTKSAAQSAAIKEEKKLLPTYPFSNPNPVPIPEDSGIYPYFTFTNFSDTAIQKEWTIITLENDYLALYILPEVGGKIYGATDKSTGEEFIPKQKEVRFVNKGKRGLWSPGGMEFNFGEDDISPSVATPVDYQLIENEDGSVSCWIGNLDLLSRKTWRVEIYLPPDKAWFETRMVWYYTHISFSGEYPVSVSCQFNEKDTSQTNLILDPFEVKTLRISKQSKKGKWSILDQSSPKTKVKEQQIAIELIEILIWMKEKNYEKTSIYVNQLLELQPENIYAIWVKAILYRLQGKQ